MSLPKWGGCPFLHAPHIARAFICSCSIVCRLSCSIVAYFQPEQGETWQKLDFICSFLSNPRNFGDRKRQKPNIFLKRGRKVGAGCGSACLTFGVSTGAGVPASGVVPSFRGVSAPLVVCSLLLVAFLPCLC